MKYWLHIVQTEKMLLREALQVNLNENKHGKPCWIRTVTYLLKVSNVMGNKLPISGIEKKRFMDRFHNNMKEIYVKWWKNQAEVTGQKLDFYHKYKKKFAYEDYLDNSETKQRKQVTRLSYS